MRRDAKGDKPVENHRSRLMAKKAGIESTANTPRRKVAENENSLPLEKRAGVRADKKSLNQVRFSIPASFIAASIWNSS